MDFDGLVGQNGGQSTQRRLSGLVGLAAKEALDEAQKVLEDVPDLLPRFIISRYCRFDSIFTLTQGLSTLS